MTKSTKTRLGALQLAVSATALSLAAGLFDTAHAQDAPTGWEASPNIVPRDGLSPVAPPPGGILDDGVIGVGQIITDAAPPGGGVGLCTGTLVNPRTVIFAAHCVNTRPANAYGSATGTVGISVGFNPNNLPAAQNWIANGWATNQALNIYNVNQVWYHPDSLLAGPGLNFLRADVAIATLDTPAFDIPQWTMLFSPLTEGTHAEIIGYGATGTGGTAGPNLGIDFRRRAAENMLDALISLNDIDEILFGEPPGGPFPQALYMADFDDPLRLDPHDFDVFDGEALPNESITAGGDSGGPLVIDQAFDRPVVAGVLSGGLSFFGSAAQPFSTYGTVNFYQPLFLYWDVIVQNNSYVYATSRPGIRNWMDPNHWRQAMDPNYAVIRDGELVNDLPDTPALGASDAATNFGDVCFLDDCVDARNVGPGENSTGPGLVIPGGPGSTNFVPNNVTPNPVAGVQARYYDVTLASIGHTYLQNTVTIDRFAIDGLLTSLEVRGAGTLNVLGDFNMWRGAVDVDGRINSGEAMLMQGLLTGRGTFNPTFLTSVDGIIAPGDLVGVGTLTVQGDVILASGNELLVELGRTQNDQLRVTADPAQGTTGIVALGGDLWLSPSSQGGGPRHGNTYTIVLADGAVQDTFDSVNGFLGVLRPQVTYNANSVTVKLKAGSFLDIILHNPALMPLALALDELREDHYDALWNVYGEIDLMDANRLSAAFSSMAPGSLMDAHGLLAMQGSAFGDTLQDRMAFLSRSGGAPMGLTVMGNPAQILAFSGDAGLGNAGELSFASMVTENRTIAMPNGISAFFSGGYDENRSSADAGRSASGQNDGLRTWHMIGGVEHSFGNATLGVAGGYSRGEAAQDSTAAFAENDLAQMAAYGVYRFDDGVYLSSMMGYGSSRTSTDRRFIAGTLDYQMQGDVTGQMFLASVEAGMNVDMFDGFTLTPHIALRQYAMVMEGFTEGGGGETALTIEEQRYGQLEARLGVRLNGEHRFTNGWTFVPSLDAAAVSVLDAEDGGVLARFAVAPDVPFYLPGAGRDDFWGEVTGGLSLVRGDTSFSLRMETSVAREELHEDRYMARYAHRF